MEDIEIRGNNVITATFVARLSLCMILKDGLILDHPHINVGYVSGACVGHVIMKAFFIRIDGRG